jgi:hypothetical protein
MRVILRWAMGAGLIVVCGTAAAAQSAGEAASWSALMMTPYGALPLLVSPGMAGLSAFEIELGTSLEARFGRWSRDEQAWNNFGVGGRGEHFGIAVGYSECEGCEEGAIMAAVDYEWVLAKPSEDVPLSLTSFVVTLRPAGGFAMSTGEGTASATSLAVDLPVSLPIPVGAESRIAAFISPGFGYGRFSVDTDDPRGGIRPSLAAGIAFVAPGALGFHLAWRKIFIEDGPGMFGLGVTYGG